MGDKEETTVYDGPTKKIITREMKEDGVIETEVTEVGTMWYQTKRISSNFPFGANIR